MSWTKRFKRVTTSSAFIPEIDGFRFAAIVSVVVFHLREQLHRYYPIHIFPFLDTLSKNGERGVRLFFVISGFILALPFARYHLAGAKAVSLKSYFARRVTRLEPPYIVSLVALAFMSFAGHHPQSARTTAEHLTASILYLHNFVFSQPSSISVVAWSLEVEIQFYLLMPLLSMFFLIRGTGLRRLCLVASILLLGVTQAVLNFAGHPRLQMSLANYLQFFLAGLLLTDLFLLEMPSPRKFSVGWDMVALLGWPAIFLLADPYVQTITPLLIVAVYWAGFNGVFVNKLFSMAVLITIGGMCYSIYLVHYSLIAVATRVIGHTHPLSMVALALALIGAVSSVFFLVIEKPCMQPAWPQRLTARLRNRHKTRPATDPLEPAYSQAEG